MPTPESRLGEAEVSGKAERSHGNEARKQEVGFHVTGSHKLKIGLRRESSQIYFKRMSTVDVDLHQSRVFMGVLDRNIFRYLFLGLGAMYLFFLTALKSLILNKVAAQ